MAKRTCFRLGSGAVHYPGTEDEEASGAEGGADGSEGGGAPAAAALQRPEPAPGGGDPPEQAADAPLRSRLRSPPPVAPRVDTASADKWSGAGPASVDDDSSDGDRTRDVSRPLSLHSCGRSVDTTPPPSRLCDLCQQRRPQPAAPPPPPRCWFLQLPPEVLHPVTDFADFRDIVALQATCSALRRVVLRRAETVNLSGLDGVDRGLCLLLVRMASHGTRVRTLVLPHRLTERYSGVIGYLLRASPLLRILSFSGSTDLSLLKEVVKHCGPLRDLHVPAAVSMDELVEWLLPCAGMLAYVLSGSPGLSRLSLGAVTVNPGQPVRPPWSPNPTVFHQGLRQLRIECVTKGLFPQACNLPHLTELVLHGGSCSADRRPSVGTEVANILAGSQQLTTLALALFPPLTPHDVRALSSCCPQLQRLRIRADADMRLWRVDSLPELLPAATLDALLQSFPLRELQVWASWETHWTQYEDLPGTDCLLLQSSLVHMTPVLLRHLKAGRTKLREAATVVLCGEVDEQLTSVLLPACAGLQRLELYCLPHSRVSDALLTAWGTGRSGVRHLHLHDATGGKGAGDQLSCVVLSGILDSMPQLTRLAVLGIRAQDIAADGADEVLSVLVNETVERGGADAPLQHLTVGPLLRTSGELLTFVGAAPSLRRLDLAWHGGDLPSRDFEFPSALGMGTIELLVNEINPNVTVRDVGSDHFNLIVGA
eukprot:TRINITY_DN14753_c0_g1_i1.p1 TRINITY_DN14753_c0_g1~~TRINITY_DN14753_c0_g1_i1.p1  ORF type:complete len:725 (+),score=257.19 TRINITY_DN14753_c0_g1_i1:44-2176(+)